ncbi:HNH endonuclease [Halopiger thermotolerans]
MDCPTCGESLSSERGMRQHHTKVHGDPLPNRICSGCGTEFYDPKARREYCDDCNPNAGEHNGNWNDAKETTTCERCEATFSYYPSNKEGRFCSTCVEQSDEFLGTPYSEVHDIERTKRVCEFCGRIIDVLQSRVEKYPVRFCSHKCHALSQTERWCDDRNVYNGKWRTTRRRALDRDDHTCQHCGRSRSDIGHEPDVHHLVPVRDFDNPQNAHTLDNVICLCRRCHRLAEIGSITVSPAAENNNS